MRMVAHIELPIIQELVTIGNPNPVEVHLLLRHGPGTLIENDDGILLTDSDSGVLMGVGSSAIDSKQHLQASTTFTLRGWDGKQRWQVSAPGLCQLRGGSGGDFELAENNLIALSPDGHVFTIAKAWKRPSQIFTWRDGRLLGVANLPSLNPDDLYQLQVTNNGRVWLNTLNENPCELWAIDGTQAIHGIYRPSFTGNQRWSIESSLSPGGSRLAFRKFIFDYTFMFKSQSFDYATVQVKNAKLIVTRRYTARSNNQGLFYNHWIDSARVMDETGMTVVDSTGEHKGVKDKCNILPGEHMPAPVFGAPDPQKQILRVYLPPPEHPWLVPCKMHLDGYACQAGGHTVLLIEDEARFSSLYASLYKLPIIGPLIPHIQPAQNQWLTIYTAPGKLRARLRLPSNGRVSAYQLSPDGHCIAVLFQDKNSKTELLFFRW